MKNKGRLKKGYKAADYWDWFDDLELNLYKATSYDRTSMDKPNEELSKQEV